MDTRDLLIAITDEEQKAKGIDYKTSIRLLDATRKNKFAEVQELVKDPKVDINQMAFPKMVDFAANFGYDLRDERHCALSLALGLGYKDIADFLLKQGAAVETDERAYGFHLHIYKSALAQVLRDSYDVSIFKTILRKTKNINIVVEEQSFVKALITSDVENKSAYVSLVFHEVVLRNQRITIDEMLSLDKKILFNLETLKQYLASLQLSSDEKLSACHGFAYLAETGFISRQAGQQLQELIDDKYKSKHPKSVEISKLREENKRLHDELAAVKRERDELKQQKSQEATVKSSSTSLFGSRK